MYIRKNLILLRLKVLLKNYHYEKSYNVAHVLVVYRA